MSETFFGMRASRIASFDQSTRDAIWEDVDYLSPDGFAFQPADPHAMQKIFSNASLLGVMPYWFRQDLLARLEPDETAAEASRGGRGTARAPRVPTRLLALGSVEAVSRHDRNILSIGYPVHAGRSDARRPSAADARRMCTTALLDITQGRRTVEDVLREAMASAEWHPYRGIELAQLLMAQPRFGLVSAERHLDRLSAFLSKDRPDGDEAIAWLLDNRAARRRLVAWAAAQRPMRARTGFPWKYSAASPRKIG